MVWYGVVMLSSDKSTKIPSYDHVKKNKKTLHLRAAVYVIIRLFTCAELEVSSLRYVGLAKCGGRFQAQAVLFMVYKRDLNQLGRYARYATCCGSKQ